MKQAEQQEKVVNGVNVNDFFSTIDAIKGEPQIAKFTFKAVNKWDQGSANRTFVNEFEGACQTFNRKEPFIFQKDEPPILLGNDSGANPAEFALAALAGCLTTSLIYHAAARGIRIEEVESTYSGDLDLHGFLGLDENVRNGYEGVKISFKVKGDAPEETLKELVGLAQKRSPVFDVFTNKVPVSVSYER
jgi:uncharacterized OsmC-like protein